MGDKAAIRASAGSSARLARCLRSTRAVHQWRLMQVRQRLASEQLAGRGASERTVCASGGGGGGAADGCCSGTAPALDALDASH